MTTIPEQLKAARKGRGWSLQHLSELMGRKTYQSVWQWESFVADPRLVHVHQWADALDMEVVLVPKGTASATASAVIGAAFAEFLHQEGAHDRPGDFAEWLLKHLAVAGMTLTQVTP